MEEIVLHESTLEKLSYLRQAFFNVEYTCKMLTEQNLCNADLKSYFDLLKSTLEYQIFVCEKNIENGFI